VLPAISSTSTTIRSPRFSTALTLSHENPATVVYEAAEQDVADLVGDLVEAPINP
jgi:hypothetical protein